MPYDDPIDDEDWYDDNVECNEPGAADCPECGKAFYNFSDKCPACGYWLSASDRGAMWSGESKPAWLKITVLVVLVVLVLSLLGVGSLFF